MVEGMICLKSVDGFTATAARLDEAMRERGIIPMLRIDHSAAAATVGLQLNPLLLLLFGNPKVGTSLMQEKATAGIDLPLKFLVWETEDGAVWTGYIDPSWIRHRHGIKEGKPTVAKMDQLLHHLMVVASGRTG